jgi:hypothetical protein
MKRFLFVLLALLLVGCSCQPEVEELEPFKGFSLPSELDEETAYSLPNTLTYDGKEYNITYDASSLFGENNVIIGVNEDKVVTISAEVEIDGKTYTFNHQITIKNIIDPFKNFDIIAVTESGALVTFPKTLTYEGKDYLVTYTFDPKLTDEGRVDPYLPDSQMTIEAKVTINGVDYKATYIVLINRATIDPFTNLYMPDVVYSKQALGLDEQVNYEGVNYPVTYKFTPDIIENGVAPVVEEDTVVAINASVIINDIKYVKEFNITIARPETSGPEFDEVLKNLPIPNVIATERYIELQKAALIEDLEFIIDYQSSDESLLTNEGKVVAGKGAKTVDLTASITHLGETYSHTYTINIAAVTATEVLNSINLPEEVDDNIDIPTEFRGYHIDWFSDNERALSSTGILSFVSEPTTVNLNAMILDDEMPDRDYVIIAKPFNAQRRLNAALPLISVPAYVTHSLRFELPYDVKYSWQASTGGVIFEDGIIVRGEQEIQTTLTLTLTAGEETMAINYEVTIEKQNITTGDAYNILHRVKSGDFNGAFSNLLFENDRLVLDPTKLSGYYESLEIPVSGVRGVEGSYSLSSSQNATGELLIRLKVGSTWSQYFTYGPWGLGNQHSSLSAHGDAIASMDTDMISVKNSQVASAVQYKVVLRRTALDVPSPKLALVNISLVRSALPTTIDINSLPREVDYDVPKVNQNEVPSIGNKICSGTSSTMLLKYKGYNFSDKDVYENRYVSYLLWDYRINYPGNWVFNTHGMSGFGELSYVRRIYNIEDMLYHLAHHGPMAASISGDVYHLDRRLYNTGGHLIVVRGYRIDNNGNITILVNDPNVNSRFGSQFFVYIEMTEARFKQVWRSVFYVIE